MPTNRRKRTRSIRNLKPWEYAYLSGDDSQIVPGTKDAVRLEIMRSDLDSWLMFGDRTARQLLSEYPEYKR